MKFPKLRGPLVSDAAIGLAQANALDNVGAFALSAVGGNSSTRKVGDFFEVTTSAAESAFGDSLWGIGMDASHHPAVVLYDWKTRIAKTYLGGPSVGEGGYISTPLRGTPTWIAMNTIATVGVATSGFTLADTVREYWLNIDRNKSAAELAPPGTGKQALSLYGLDPYMVAMLPVQYTPIAYPPDQLGVIFSGYATGYDEVHPDTPRGSAAYSWTRNVDGTNFLTTPVDGSANYFYYSRPFVIGHSSAAFFKFKVSHRIDTVTPGHHYHPADEAPVLMVTNDFGATWGSVSAAFLVPFLTFDTFTDWLEDGTTPTVTRYSHGQIRTISGSTVGAYVGGGEALLAIPGLNPGAHTYDNRSWMYSYSAGAFTAHPWPGSDAEYYSDASSSAVSIGPYGPTCVGPGCFVCFMRRGSVFADPTPLVTYDSGANWEYLPAISADLFVDSVEVLRPHKDGKLGKLLMTGRADGETFVITTDTRFGKWSARRPIKTTLATPPTKFLQIASRRKMVPALPAEF